MREEGRHEESAEEVTNVDEDVCRGEDKGTVDGSKLHGSV